MKEVRPLPLPRPRPLDLRRAMATILPIPAGLLTIILPLMAEGNARAATSKSAPAIRVETARIIKAVATRSVRVVIRNALTSRNARAVIKSVRVAAMAATATARVEITVVDGPVMAAPVADDLQAVVGAAGPAMVAPVEVADDPPVAAVADPARRQAVNVPLPGQNRLIRANRGSQSPARVSR